MQIDLTSEDLRKIRDAVQQLDLVAIRALSRAGFTLVPSGNVIEPKPTLALQQLPRRGRIEVIERVLEVEIAPDKLMIGMSSLKGSSAFQ